MAQATGATEPSVLLPGLDASAVIEVQAAREAESQAKDKADETLRQLMQAQQESRESLHHVHHTPTPPPTCTTLPSLPHNDLLLSGSLCAA